MSTQIGDLEVAAVQRRTIRTLLVTQALGGIGLSAGIAVAALLALHLTGSEELAGLTQTMQVLGAAVVASVLAAIMARRGRRVGLSIGYTVGAIGAGMCIIAGITGWFPIQLVGAGLLGATTSANNQSRYAATDLAATEHRGRDLSVVMWATTIGSVIGPNLVGPGASVARALHVPELVGPFVFGVVAMVLAVVVLQIRLRPDPLLTAQRVQRERRAPVDGDATRPAVTTRDAWATVRESRVLMAAIAGMACSHVVMVSVMVMTPIHMDHGGASIELVGLVISIHILGMYAFSPFVGRAVDRWGSPRTMLASGVVLLASLALASPAHAGASWRLGAGLFLLGVGWSLGMIASSTMLVAATPEPVRPQVQGLADTITGFAAAGGGATAGLLLGTIGYSGLGVIAACLTSVVVIAAVVADRARRAGSARAA